MSEEIDWKEELIAMRVALQQIANILSAYITMKGNFDVPEGAASYSEADIKEGLERLSYKDGKLTVEPREDEKKDYSYYMSQAEKDVFSALRGKQEDEKSVDKSLFHKPYESKGNKSSAVREGTPTDTDSKPQTYVTEESKMTLKEPIIYMGKEFKNLKSCKYGCGHWVSFDHYKKGDEHWGKPVHFTKTLKPIGMGCPKYEK